MKEDIIHKYNNLFNPHDSLNRIRTENNIDCELDDTIHDFYNSNSEWDIQANISVDTNIGKLNSNQEITFNKIKDLIDNYENNCLDDGSNLIFLDAPGGTGKTFIFNFI